MGYAFLRYAAGPFAIAAISLSSGVAFAQSSPWSPDTARILSDPLYLPLAGQIYGSTDFSYGIGSLDTFNSAGARTSSSATRTAGFGQSLAYGITDDLSIHAGATYDFLKDRVSPVAGGGFTLDSNGFTDPSFGLTYRVLDQRFYPLDVDLSLDYAPDIVAAVAPSRTQNGSVAAGDHQIIGGLGVGREWRAFTLKGVFHLIYNTGPRVTLQPSGDTRDVNSNWEYFLGLNSQYRFTPRLSLNADLGYTINQSRGIFVPQTGVASTFDPGNALGIGAALNYHLIPNRLVGSLTYTHDFFGDGSTDFVATPIADTETRNRSSDIFGIRLQYAF